MSITKKVKFSQGFANVTGLSEGTRAEAVKAVWAYATTNNLKSQKSLPLKNDPSKTRNSAVILPDAGLKQIFGDAEFYAIGEIARGVSANVVA